MHRALVIATATLAVLVAAGCSEPASPEVQIRKVLDRGVAALEARDASGAAEVLADDYKDDRGRDRQKLKGLAFFALQRGPVLVSLQNVAIRVEEETAEVALHVLAVQGSGTLKTARDLLPTNARAFDLAVKLKKVGSDWKITSIDGLSGSED